MTPLKFYDVVRVIKVVRPVEDYDGWRINQRGPQVGDIGVFIELLQAPNLPDHYVVECSGSDGITIWLGEFLIDEIEPVS
jgi:hypothetical protein